MSRQRVPEAALQQARPPSRSTDSDFLSVTLIQRSGSTKHFIIVETFASKADDDRNAQADYVRSFRATLYPTR